MKVCIKGGGGIRGEIEVPGDKSITHRAFIMGLLSKGETLVRNALRSADTEATLNFLKALGGEIIERSPTEIVIKSEGMGSLKEPQNILDAMNSGTTARLFCGVLSASDFFSVITGDESLRKRPMNRVTVPLRMMGSKIEGREKGNYLPISICGTKLKGIHYKIPIPSAQVKSALILAGLFAEGETELEETGISRDHTERMLPFFGGKIEVSEGKIKVKGPQELHGTEITVPGDISSASYFIAGATIVKDSEIVIKNVGLNETRTGFIRILKEMGAEITFEDIRKINGEEIGTAIVRTARNLKGINVGKDIIPTMIDEVPLLALVACFAEGETIVRGAEELKKKESDRILTTFTCLKKLGANIEMLPDGFIIRGRCPLKGGEVESYGDHRIAMTMSIAGLTIPEGVWINGFECVNISFPSFKSILDSLKR